MPTWGMWLILVWLLLIRGMMAAFEAAIMSISDARVRELAQNGDSRRGNRLAKLKADSETVATALRVGMILSGFLAAAIGAIVPPRLFGLSISAHGDAWWISPLASALIVALLASGVDLVFRSAASQKPEAWALSLSAFGTGAIRLFAPFVRMLVILLNAVGRPFAARVSLQSPLPAIEELEKQLIRQAQKDEVDKGAPQLIRSIFQLSDKTCRDVMVPRTNVIAIDTSTPIDSILQLIAEENHSRIPVYRHDVDHVVGILHVRDIVPMLRNPELIVLTDLLRPAAYVPWVKPVGDLLREMQRQRIHMAVVVDEYGGFSGIVTLEDILREIVGDISDEFEAQATSVEKQADDSLLVDAMMPIDDFGRSFDFKFPEGSYETLGGFLAHLAGAIPDANDRFVLHGWTFIVASKDGPRIDRIRVLKPKSTVTIDRRPSQDLLERVRLTS